MVLPASTREPAGHVFARLACFLGLCLPLSIFLYSLTFFFSHFCLFTASLSLFPPSTVCLRLLSERDGLIIWVWSKLPFLGLAKVNYGHTVKAEWK